MNISALRMAYALSYTFQVRLAAALQRVTRFGHSVAHVRNRQGRAVLAVRYSKASGFEFRNAHNRVLPKSEVFKILREVL